VPIAALAAYARCTCQDIDWPPESTLKRKSVVISRKFYMPKVPYDPQERMRNGKVVPPSPLLRGVQRHWGWATPRATAGWWPYDWLTERGARDLAAQVRHEQSTPDCMRDSPINPGWVAWLMGFPPSHSHFFQRRWV
jgi:hypothetical protein